VSGIVWFSASSTLNQRLVRRTVGLLCLVGASIPSLFGMLYSMVTLDTTFRYVAALGAVLMGH